MDSAWLLLVLALMAQVSRCDDKLDNSPAGDSDVMDVQVLEEETECVSGIGTDCLTVVKIIIIATSICVGSALLIGGFLLYFFLRARHSVRGHRIYRCLASCCCCEVPREDDSLIDVIVDNQNQTTDSAAATGDNPAEMKNDSMSSPPPLLFSTKDDQAGQRPLLSPSEIKQESGSPPPAGAEGAGDEVEVLEDKDTENKASAPARQAQAFPFPAAAEGEGKDIKSEPVSPIPQTYAEAVKTPPLDTSKSSGGGHDVTDTSTPTTAGKKKFSIKDLFKRPLSPAPVKDEDEAVLVDHEGQPDLEQPVSPATKDQPEVAKDQSEVTKDQPEVAKDQPEVTTDQPEVKEEPTDESDKGDDEQFEVILTQPADPQAASGVDGQARVNSSRKVSFNAEHDTTTSSSSTGSSPADATGTSHDSKGSSKKRANKSGSKLSEMFRSFLSSGADESQNDSTQNDSAT